MKNKINRLLNWFENHFNFLIELLAFIGGIFCILFALFIFIMMMTKVNWISELSFELIILPGVFGFLGVMILFSLRITRHMTKDGMNK